MLFPLNDFGLATTYPFVIYKFHPQYDGVIGYNLMKDLQLNLDLKNKILTNGIVSHELHLQEVKPRENLPIDLSHLNQNLRNQLTKILQSNKSALQLPGEPLNFTNKIKHNIRTIDDNPVYVKRYRYPEVHKAEIKRQIEDLLGKNIIRPSISPWSFPIVIVPKKCDQSGKQKWRMAIDYRKLNEKTIDDKFPIPNIDEILDKLKDAKYFSTIDLASGYHQIELDKESIEKTAFTTDDGHFEFLRMPFGLKNAPSTFQRVMNQILQPILGKICVVYMDDILIYSKDPNKHLADIQTVLQLLKKENLKIQLDKSYFFKNEVNFLGFKISDKGVEPNPKKVEAIKNFPIPKTQKEIKSYLGMIGYYRKFIPNFSKLTKPLTQCLKKDSKINIENQEYQEAFNTSKNMLINYPILQFPDFKQPFILTTDASKYAIGAILSQGNPPNDLPIAFASRTLNKAEINYSTIEKELLAIVWATKYFRPYIFGRKFTVYTDHQPLTWWFKLKETSSRLMRWRIKLEEFSFEIKYRKGANNNADALSRIKNEEFNINKEEISSDLDSILPQITQEDLEDILKITEDEDSDLETVHSNEKDPILNIPYTERALNVFQFQIIFKNGKQFNVSRIKLHNQTKFRQIVSISQENQFTKFLKEYISPEKTYGIFFQTKDIEKPFIRYAQKSFDSGSFKFKISNTLLEDIEDDEEQIEKIKLYHETKTTHRGIQENLESVKKKFYFPNMATKIQQYINGCDICQKNKYERQPNKLIFKQNPIGEKPFEHLYVDTINISKTPCLTLVDSFSRHGQCFILKSKTAIEIIECLIRYFSNHGTPKKITTDNGTEFKNGIIQDFVSLHNIEVHYITNYNPTSNSLVERFHSTLIEQIRVIEDKNLGLREKLNRAVLSYNNSIHSTLKYTPLQIIKSDLNYSLPLENTNNDKVSNYIAQYNSNLKEISQVLTKNNEKNDKQREKLNENRSGDVDLHENKKTFLKLPADAKLKPRFKETKIKILDNVLIKEPDKGHIYHKSKIKQRKI